MADEVPSFDEMPSFDDMHSEEAPTQASAGGSAAPLRFDDIPSFDNMPGDKPAPEGKLKTFAREAASSVLPGLAAIGGAVAAPAIAGSVIGPVGTVAGLGLGIAGALAGGYVGGKVQDAGKEALGLDDSTQLAANREENPGSAIAGQIAGSMTTMSPSMGAGAVERLLAGGVMGGVTAGQELATTGKVDPTELAMSAAAGAVAPRFNKFGQKLADTIEGAVARIPGRPNKTANPQAAPVQDEAAASQQATVTGENSLQQPAPTATGDTTGNPQSAPERSERVYGKGKRPADYQNDMLSQGEMAPDVASALAKSTEQAAVGDYSNEPRPAIPQPEAKPPTIDQSLQEAPIKTGITDAGPPAGGEQAPAPVIGKPNRAERQAQLDSITEKPAAGGLPPGHKAVANNMAMDEKGNIYGPLDPTKPASMTEKDVIPKFDQLPDESIPKEASAARNAATEAHPEPTPGQKEAENYKMGHSRMFGRAVSLENAKGSTRTAKDGSWKVENLPYDYGKFLGTKGADGDHIDLMNVGTGDKHFIVDQRNADTGAFDEHKVIAYAKDVHDATDHYNRGFSDDRGPDRLGSIKEVSADDLKSWLAKPGAKKKPFDPNFKAEAVGPSEGTKPLPKVVTAAVKKVNETVTDPALRKKMVDELMGMEPSKQLGAASKIVNETDKVPARPDRIRGAVPTVEGLVADDGTPITARSKGDAAAKSADVKKMNDAYAAIKFKDAALPTSKEEKSALRQQVQEFHDAVKDVGYKPAVKHEPYLLARAAKKLLVAKNPTDKSWQEFIGTVKQLQSGDAAGVRSLNRTDSDIGMSKRSGEDALTNAENARAAPGRNDVEDAMIEHIDQKRFETPHEEAEAMVKPEAAVTKADVERLSPKAGDLDLAKPKDRAKLQKDTTTLANNLIKVADRKPPKGVSEGAASEGKKIALDNVDMKKIMADLERAQNKNRDKGALNEDELGTRDDRVPLRNEIARFFDDERGSLDYKKIAQDFRNKVLPALKYFSRMSGTPINERMYRADATFAQANSTADARQAEKAHELFGPQVDKHTGEVLDGRFYQWLDKASPADAMTYQKTIENPDLKTKADVVQALLKAGISHNKVDWMGDEALFHRALMDRVWQEDKLHGSDQAYIQNYVAHIFAEGKVDGLTADQWIERRVQNLGPTWYQKERVFDQLQAAIKAGFKPKYTNPIELLNARLDASIRSNAIVDAARGLNKDGLAFNLNDLPDHLEHLKRHPDWQFQRRLPDGNTWAINKDVSQLWVNAIEPKGLNENQGTPGSLYRTWMGAKRFTVPIQLAMSAFHALHEIANIAIVQNFHTMMERSLTDGKWKDNIVQMGKNIAKDTVFSLPMVLPGVNSLVKNKPFFKNYEGMRMQDVWRTPDKDLKPEDLMWKRLFQEAGASPYQSREDVIGAKRALAQAVADFGRASDKVGPGMRVALRGIQRGMEKMQEPLFKDTIPAMKNMALKRAIAAAVLKNPDLAVNADMRKQVLRKLGKDLDDRFGEMFYKNLFWNKTAKDIGVGSMLSLSWNLGQVRQLAGAASEVKTKLLDIVDPSRAANRSPIEAARLAASNKIGFVTAYAGLSMATAGMISYALTGEMPTGMDYLYPRNGHTNPEDGSPQRLTTMFNTREAVMLKAHADERNSLIGGLAQLVWNKTVLQPVAELATNKDFFGRKLYDTNAPWWKAALQGVDSTLGRTFNPVSISGASRAKELGGGKTGEALSFLGFGPAPKYINETPLERRINHLYAEEGTTASKPYQYGEKTGLGRGLVQDTIRGIAGDKLQAEDLMDARRRLALGDPDARKDLIEKGKLDKNTVRRMMPGQEFEHKFSKLPVDTQLALVPKMTNEEFTRFVGQNRLISRSHMAQLQAARATNP